ncbi:PREDICTED: putative F-box protein At1g71320 [Camelina sativa]|uniref:F-box protein At1g71320 n=1 Tax=Camelina sativa TaxID=90675 RepID=A0ABM0ZCF9_CAMSA|nr:PREDICTED: putative F-box protein At1g71320 [Camelina sativa]
MIESSYLAKKRLVRYPSPKLLVIRSELCSDRCSINILLETISKDGHEDHSKIFLCSYKKSSLYPYINNIGHIMGYCDGLVCIYQSENIYIINPTTRKLRILYREFLLKCTGLPGMLEAPVIVGFGRDIVTGSYKIVLMYLYDHINNKTLFKTEVFNLNDGEQRCITFPIFYNDLSGDKVSVFANGSLYWLNIYNQKIVALDLHTEIFSEVLLPSWFTADSFGVYLWSLKDRLCISDVLQYPDVDVWGLQQEGPNVMRWEKIISVTILINILSTNCLDANFWKLGLAAYYFSSSGRYPADNSLDQVPDDHCSSICIFCAFKSLCIDTVATAT